jgi:hypothetical protein
MTPIEPAIDVVLCTANRDKVGLMRSLRSLGESTCRNVRVLLVNDSADPLPEDLPVGELDINIVDLGANVGLTRALKMVEPILTAPLVARMDCGDTMSPHRLERQRDFLLRNSKYVLVGARATFLLRAGATVENIGLSASADNIPNLGKYLLWRNPFVHGSIMFRRIAFLSVGGYNPRFTIAQDFNLYMRMRKYGELHILPEVLCTHTYNLCSSNTVKRNKSSLASSLRSRLTLSTNQERLSLLFLTGVLRDLLLLMLPSKFLVWLRFARRRRMNKNVTH